MEKIRVGSASLPNYFLSTLFNLFEYSFSIISALYPIKYYANFMPEFCRKVLKLHKIYKKNLRFV